MWSVKQELCWLILPGASSGPTGRIKDCVAHLAHPRRIGRKRLQHTCFGSSSLSGILHSIANFGVVGDDFSRVDGVDEAVFSEIVVTRKEKRHHPACTSPASKNFFLEKFSRARKVGETRSEPLCTRGAAPLSNDFQFRISRNAIVTAKEPRPSAAANVANHS